MQRIAADSEILTVNARVVQIGNDLIFISLVNAAGPIEPPVLLLWQRGIHAHPDTNRGAGVPAVNHAYGVVLVKVRVSSLHFWR